MPGTAEPPAEEGRLLDAELQAEKNVVNALEAGRLDEVLGHLEQYMSVLERRLATAKPNDGEAFLFIDKAEKVAYGAANLKLFRFGARCATRAVAVAERDFPAADTVLARALKCKGDLLHQSGDYVASLPCLERSLALYKKAWGDPLRKGKGSPEMVGVLLSLGAALQTRGEKKEGLKYYREALEMARTLYPPGQETNLLFADCLMDVGNALARAGKWDEADDLYKEAARIVMQQHSMDSVRRGMRFLEFKMQMHSSKGQIEKAVDSAKGLLKSVDTVFPRDKYPAWDLKRGEYSFYLGRLYARKGEAASAREFCEKGIELLGRVATADDQFAYGNPWLASWTQSLGDVYAMLGDRGRARSCYSKALWTRRSIDEGFLAGASAAEAYASGASPLGTLWRILSVTGEADDPAEVYGDVWNVKGLIGRGIFARQRILETALSAAIDVPPDAREEIKRLIEVRAATRHRMSSLLFSPGPANQAGKAGVREQLQELGKASMERDRRLAALLPAWKRQQSLRVPPYTELIGKLPPNVVFVDFVRYGRRRPHKEGHELVFRAEFSYAAFVLAAGQPVQRVELDARAAEDALSEWWQAIQQKQRTGAGEDVRRLVWDPVRRCFPKDTRAVLICPDGPLAFLPWPALPVPGRPGYLLQEMTTAVVPFGAFLLDAPPPPASEVDERLLLVGDVDYGRSPAAGTRGATGRGGAAPLSFGPLENSRSELHRDTPVLRVRGRGAHRAGGDARPSGREAPRSVARGVFDPRPVREPRREDPART
jgi:tetratricopeptide (TPR) repeat protein